MWQDERIKFPNVANLFVLKGSDLLYISRNIMWLSGAALSTNLLAEEDPKNNSHLALKDKKPRVKTWELEAGALDMAHRHSPTDLQESKSPK